jgi:hypothetical protein
MFKGFAIFLVERQGSSLTAFPMSHPVPLLLPFPGARCLKDRFCPTHLHDPAIHLRSLKVIPTITFIQPVSDFHPFHVFLSKELHNISLLHFHDRRYFLEGAGNFGGVWRALTLMTQSNSVIVLFSSSYPIRGAELSERNSGY